MSDSEFKMRVLEDLAIIKTCAKQTDKDLIVIKKSIYGNGVPGLKTQMLIAYICLFLLAIDNPLVCKMFAMFAK